MTAVLGGLMATGCYFNRGIDETFETDRYTMRMVSWDMDVDSVNRYDDVYGGTVPEIAAVLAIVSDTIINSTTMYWYDQEKQGFLPGYTYFIVDRDTTQPKDYTSLLRAMMEKGVLRADTTYEPMLVLEVFDTVRFDAGKDSLKAITINEDGDTIIDNYCYSNAVSIMNNLRESYRKPIVLAPGLSPWRETHWDWSKGNWDFVVKQLEQRGLRIVPDPQGRKMRVVEFNRCKGKI
jgi:hypothetical protein